MVCLGCQQKMNVNSSYLGSSLILKNSSVSCYQPKARRANEGLYKIQTLFFPLEQCKRAVCPCIKNKRYIKEDRGVNPTITYSPDHKETH